MILRADIKYDLLILLGLTAFMVLNIAFLQSPVLRVTFGLPYIVLFPGYSLTAAIFPRNSEVNLLERLGLSFILSIAIVSITGLALNYSQWGIKLVPFLVLLTSFILVACTVAYWRRQRLISAERFVLRVLLDIPDWKKQDYSSKYLTLILILALGIAITAVIYMGVVPGPQEAFTEFYVLGTDLKLGGHPRLMVVGEPISLILRVVNHEHAELQYRIQREIDEGTVEVASQRVGPGEMWGQTDTFTLTKPGEDREVTFLLYKGDEREPYRSLHLRITVKERPSTACATCLG